MTLTGQFAGAFADVALKNVTREYPRHIIHLLTAPAADLAPRTLHPAFYGSYDWHSAVHMHWLLARLLGTRLRVEVNDKGQVDQPRLKSLGAAGVIEVGNSVQAVFGTDAEALKNDINDIL